MSDESSDSPGPGADVTVWLPPGPGAPGSAREAARDVAAEAPQETGDAIQLVVSELVTNSLKHAGLTPKDRIGLVAQRSPGKIRIEVWDPGPGFDPPKLDSSLLMRPSGWGLYLVDRLADRWGVERGGGMRVWSEFDL